MRKTLKRLLCTAVATVAAVGTLMTVNAVSVFAETAIWDWYNNNPTFTFSEDNTSETLEANNSNITLTVAKSPNNSAATWDNYFKANGNNVAFKNGAIIRVPVKHIGDKVTVVPYPNYTDGTNTPTDGVIVHTASAKDAENKYIELTGTQATYLYCIILEEKNDITADKCTWSFTSSVGNMPENAAGKFMSDVDGVSLTANGGKFSYNNSNSYQINNANIKVPVFNIGDVVTLTAYSGQGNNLYIGNDNASSNTLSHTATTEDKAQGYVLIEAKGSGYITAIELELNTNKLNGSATDKKAAIIAKGTETYVIAIIPADFVKNSTILKVKATGKDAITVDTVYTTVSINGNNYTAEQLGGAAGDYLHGFVVSSANDPSSLATVQDNVTVSLS